MANEAVFKRGTHKTVNASIGSISNNAMSASIGSYTSTDTLDYPDAEFMLEIKFDSLPTENSTIDLHVRPMNMAGTVNDHEAPDNTYRPHFLGSFVVNNVTTTQYLRCVGRDLPKEGDLYLFVNNAGQATSGTTLGKLYMTPLTLGPAA